VKNSSKSAEQNTFRTMLSAQARSRLLFDRELALDSSENPVYNQKTLEGLISQREVLEKQKAGMIRNIALLIFSMYLVANGQDIEVPWINLRLSDVPGLNSLLGLASTSGLLFLAFAMVSSGAYTGLIEQFTKKLSINGLLDPDILTASLTTQQLFLKIFRVRFHTFQEVHIKPTFEGRLVYNLAIFLPVLILLGMFGAAYLFIGYFLFQHIPNNYFGIGSKALSIGMLFASLFINLASLLPLRQRWQLSELDTPLPDRSAKKV
tara:strand:- start:25 stop:816 length:792 start_codon:yes stop_codon:yes gene_type:complete